MIGSLFSGIGGLELGLERAGLGSVAWQVEIDPFCRHVLEKHWPDAKRYDDVRGFCAPRLGLERPSLICGGFPCQDVSVAGKGAGLAGTRSGLWVEFERIVDECQPAIVVVENVAHGSERWRPRVASDLEALGYVPATVLVSAGSLGAPHRRDRAFVVADPIGLALRYLEQREPARRPRGVRDAGQAVALDDGAGGHASGSCPWQALPRVGGMGDGLSSGLDDARLRALGNAVCPQQAEVIGRFIREALSI